MIKDMLRPWKQATRRRATITRAAVAAGEPHHTAEHAADSFDGLPSNVRRFDLMELLDEVGRKKGWTDALLAHFQMFLKFTRDEDWTRGNRPIVYLTVETTAKRLAVSPPQVQRNDRRLSGQRRGPRHPLQAGAVRPARDHRQRRPPRIRLSRCSTPFRPAVGWRRKRLPAFRSRCSQPGVIHRKGRASASLADAPHAREGAVRHCPYSQNSCGQRRKFYLSHENHRASVSI